MLVLENTEPLSYFNIEIYKAKCSIKGHYEIEHHNTAIQRPSDGITNQDFFIQTVLSETQAQNKALLHIEERNNVAKN